MRARGRVAGLSVGERRHLSRTNKPRQVIPRQRIAEVSERVDRNGEIVVRLERADAERAVAGLLEQGVNAIAVCLLWSPRNPEHELLVADVIRLMAPHIHVSLSHKIAPVIGEYERAATAAVNAYVAPVVDSYLRSIQDDLSAAGLKRPMMVIQADGGSTLAGAILPVRTIESGPAAGMVGVKLLSEAIGEPNVIATDVGGTTFKVGLLTDGSWGVARETIINQYTLAMPMVDLASIGAGGGSIAWVDAGRLRIGPESAAAEPGPACYGLGGTRPTVTDADLVLGFIGTDRLLGGRIRLQRNLACDALKRHVADELFDGDVMAAAAAVRMIVDAQMADLVRKTTLERGHDPRRYVLIAYGGSGPVHAADYAAGLGITRVVIPIGATVYSALGAAMSDVRYSLEEPLHEALSNPESIRNTLDRLETEVRQAIQDLGVGARTRIDRWADVRYEKQLHSLRIELDPVAVSVEGIAERFERKYVALYGSGTLLPSVPLRILRVGVDGIGELGTADLPQLSATASTVVRSSSREVYWPASGRYVPTSVWDGEHLVLGTKLRGPALIEYPGTTVALPEAAEAAIDEFGNVRLELDSKS